MRERWAVHRHRDYLRPGGIYFPLQPSFHAVDKSAQNNRIQLGLEIAREVDVMVMRKRDPKLPRPPGDPFGKGFEETAVGAQTDAFEPELPASRQHHRPAFLQVSSIQ